MIDTRELKVQGRQGEHLGAELEVDQYSLFSNEVVYSRRRASISLI